MNGSDRTGPAWERPGPTFERFAATTRDVLLEPTAFFRDMRTTGGLGPPLTYGIAGTLLGGLFNAIYQLVLSTLGVGLDGPEAVPTQVFTAMFATGCVVVILPAVAVLSLFVGSAIYHLMLWLLGFARLPYEATLRVSAYAMGGTALLNVVPLCGGIVAGIWAIVATIIGLSQAHEISLGKSAAAVLIPVVACCVAVVLLYAALAVLVLGGVLAGLSR